MNNKIIGPVNWNYPLIIHCKLYSGFVLRSLVDLFAIDDIANGTIRISYLIQDSLRAQLLNLELHHGVLSKVISCITVYPGLSWLEREVWDMFGIFFWGNMDLRRILTAYGFVGHPLTKDFPLSGFKEVWYDDTVRAVINVGAEFSQEFRSNNY